VESLVRQLEPVQAVAALQAEVEVEAQALQGPRAQTAAE